MNESENLQMVYNHQKVLNLMSYPQHRFKITVPEKVYNLTQGTFMSILHVAKHCVLNDLITGPNSLSANDQERLFQEFGKAHALFSIAESSDWTKNKKINFKNLLGYGDLHWKNIFWNFFSNRFELIDTETMVYSLKKEKDLLKDLTDLFFVPAFQWEKFQDISPKNWISMIRGYAEGFYKGVMELSGNDKNITIKDGDRQTSNPEEFREFIKTSILERLKDETSLSVMLSDLIPYQSQDSRYPEPREFYDNKRKEALEQWGALCDEALGNQSTF